MQAFHATAVSTTSSGDNNYYSEHGAALKPPVIVPRRKSVGEKLRDTKQIKALSCAPAVAGVSRGGEIMARDRIFLTIRTCQASLNYPPGKVCIIRSHSMAESISDMRGEPRVVNWNLSFDTSGMVVARDSFAAARLTISLIPYRTYRADLRSPCSI